MFILKFGQVLFQHDEECKRQKLKWSDPNQTILQEQSDLV